MMQNIPESNEQAEIQNELEKVLNSAIVFRSNIEE